MIPKCSGCGAEVIWTITEKNRKPMMVNPKPEKRVVFLRDPADPKTPVARVVDTFIAHFATCPEAARFRKAKGTEKAAQGEAAESADVEEPVE